MFAQYVHLFLNRMIYVRTIFSAECKLAHTRSGSRAARLNLLAMWPTYQDTKIPNPPRFHSGRGHLRSQDSVPAKSQDLSFLLVCPFLSQEPPS